MPLLGVISNIGTASRFVCLGVGEGGGGEEGQQASGLSSKHKLWNFHRYIIILYPDKRRPTTMCGNDVTLGNTPFQLISDFFHVNKVRVLSMLSKLPPGVCWRGGATGLLKKGGGSNRLPGLVTKQHLWNFHRYRLVAIYYYNYCYIHGENPRGFELRENSY